MASFSVSTSGVALLGLVLMFQPLFLVTIQTSG